MKKRFKTPNSFKLKNIISITIVLILIVTINFFVSYNTKMSAGLAEVALTKIEEISNSIINESFSREIFGDILEKEIIIVHRNKNDEIISLDFALNEAYEVLRRATRKLQASINELKAGQISPQYNVNDDYLGVGDRQGFILKIPLGVATKNFFLGNLGPRIPVKVNFVGSVITGFNTKVTPYGINNSLIELFVKVSLQEQIIFPVTSTKKKVEGNILLAAKVVEGNVPTIYNGNMEANSKILTIPIEK